jgi:hypothetical protein
VSSVEWMETEKDMKKKITVLTLCAMLFALSYSASAQQPKKVPRIGYLTGADAATESARSGGIRLAAMWMSSPLHTRPLFSFFLHDFSTSRPKRDLLLFVARHTAVTLTRNAPLFRAQGPGISVSSAEPSGVFLSRFCQPSSRSLGRCLLLGQRS